VLLVNGGTEERGPITSTAGHTIMSRHRAVEIAKRLGNALVAPILPISPRRTGVSEAPHTRAAADAGQTCSRASSSP